MPKLNNEIRPRYWSRADMGAEHFNGGQLNSLSNMLETNLLNDLDLPLDDNGAAPKRGGFPRLFAITTDDKGKEVINDLSRDPKVKSEEFWRQVQLGNVFAYPAGADKPVQLQVKVANDGRASLQYSKPVEPEELPQPPAKRLNVFKWIAWGVTLGHAFNKQRLEYNRQRQNAAETKGKLNAVKSDRMTNLEQNEKIQADARRAELAERAKKAELRKRYESADAHTKENELGISNVTSIFAPVPKYNAEFDRDAKKDSVKKEGLYDQKEFNDLKKYDIDLNSIQVGNSGKTVTEEEFAAVGFFTVCKPEHAMKIENIQRGDRHIMTSLSELGFPPQDHAKLASAQPANFAAGDLFMDPPRDRSGRFFKDAVNPARKETFEAFKAYKAGEKAKLAGLIANGINRVGEEAAGLDIPQVPTQARSYFVMGEKLLDLMDKDPELKDIALQNGMDPGKLKTAEGVREMNKVALDARKYERAFASFACEPNADDMNPHHKKLLLKGILKDRIICTKLAAENTTTNDLTKEYFDKVSVNQNFASNIDYKGYVEHPETRPEPGQGKIWSDSANAIFTGIQNVYNHQPVTVQDLTDPRKMSMIDQMAEEIIDRHHLTDLSANELADMFSYRDNKGLKLSEDISIAEKNIAEQHRKGNANIVNEPEEELDLINKMDNNIINNRVEENDSLLINK